MIELYIRIQLLPLELKNVLEKFHDFIKNLKNLALSNLTNLTISQEYLIQTVLKRKKMKQSDWLQKVANHRLISLDGRT